MGRCVLDLVGESLVGVLQPHTISKDGDLHVYMYSCLLVQCTFIHVRILLHAVCNICMHMYTCILPLAPDIP